MKRKNWLSLAVAMGLILVTIPVLSACKTEPPPVPETADHGHAAPAVSRDQINSVMLGIYVVDSFGFHGMQKNHEVATEVGSRDAGKVAKVVLTVKAMDWPHELEALVDAFLEDAETLVAALAAKDLDASRAAVAEVHKSQHSLSSAVYLWLEAQIEGTEFDPPEGHHH